MSESYVRKKERIYRRVRIDVTRTRMSLFLFFLLFSSSPIFKKKTDVVYDDICQPSVLVLDVGVLW